MSALTSAHSHWIQSHGYSNGVMTLITKTGESYAATIPESRYSEFLKAPSQGGFFNLYIKPFATVTKVDVAEAVALVEKAKAKVALDSKIDELATKIAAAATTNPRGRKAPAKSLLPTEPAPEGATDAWIDFRCIADPTTGPGLVKALKRFIENKDKTYEHYIPYCGYDPYRTHPGEVCIAALNDWGTGKVDKKYLKAFPKDATDYKALAKSYRSAYRSWVRRNEAREAKVAKNLVKAGIITPKPLAMPSNPVVQVVTVPVGVTQERVNKALQNLVALENGQFYVTISDTGATSLKLMKGSLVFAVYQMSR